MFYDEYHPYNCRNLLGKIADYSLVEPMKQKCINLYVPSVPLTIEEELYNRFLVNSLPKGLPYGVRVRIWDLFHPNMPYTGMKVSYSVFSGGSGEAVEIVFEPGAFRMADVPWEDIIA